MTSLLCPSVEIRRRDCAVPKEPANDNRINGAHQKVFALTLRASPATDAKRLETATYNMPHSRGQYWTMWLLKCHEDIAGRAARPHLQIAQDCFPDFVLQRIALISSALGTLDAERLFAPIDVDQPQTRNLAAAQRIDGAQQQNGMSAQRLSCGLLALMPEQSADIAPLRALGSPRSRAYSWTNF